MFKPLKPAIKSALAGVGLISDRSPAPHIKTILAGEQMVAADVGAAGWLPFHWQDLEGGIEFLFFEPHPESYEKLVQRAKRSKAPDKVQVLQTALSGTGGRRTLHLLNVPTGSSLLPVDFESEFVDEQDPYFFPMREEEVDTQRLSYVLDEAGTSLHMMKLDVQGAEYEILDGMGRDRRDDLVMVEAEVNMAGGGYVGCPTFTEIRDILTPSGLRLYDVNVVRTYRKKHGNKFWYHENVFDVYNESPSISGRTWEFDVMYFKDYQKLMDLGDLVQIRRLLVALCAYRFYNEAYFITERCEKETLIDGQEAQVLKDAIVGWHNDSARQFWYGRSSMMQWLRSVTGAAH